MSACAIWSVEELSGFGLAGKCPVGEMSCSHAVCRPGLCNGPVDDMTLYKPPFSRFVNHLSRRMLLIGVCVETRCTASCNNYIRSTWVKALKRDEQNSARLTHAANLSIRVGGLSSVLILHMQYFIRAHGWYTEPFSDMPKDFWHAGHIDKRKRLDRLMIGYFVFLLLILLFIFFFFGGG